MVKTFLIYPMSDAVVDTTLVFSAKFVRFGTDRAFVADCVYSNDFLSRIGSLSKHYNLLPHAYNTV